jgi:hypothetical protein
LKNIYVSERLSKESTAFQASLYINGRRAGIVANYGQGGATKFRPRDEWSADLIQEAKLWCGKLPPVVCTGTNAVGKPAVIPMDMVIYIENMILDWLRKRDVERFGKKVERYMLSAILFGVPGKSFRIMEYRLPIATMIGMDKGIERLRLDIHKKVLPMLLDNEMILNTNIPAEIIRRLEVPAGKWVEQESAERV